MTDQTQNSDLGSADIQPAFVYATSRDWAGYFQAIDGRDPRETTTRAIELFENELGISSGDQCLQAIDLGCGEGRDSAALLRAGWCVHSIDGHPNGIQRLVGRSDLSDPHRLTMQLSSFEQVVLNPCLLVNASFSLPFCPPTHFDRLWDQICGSIVSGGRFSGQLFGDRDSWGKLPDRSHHTKTQVEQLLEPFEVEYLKEEERKGEDCTGTKKDWHVFHIVAKKK